MTDDMHVPNVENWSDADQKIVVTSKPGFLWSVLLRAKIDASPDIVYKILTDENPQNIFRGIKAVTYRNVVEEDKRTGRKKLEVCHRAYTKFLFISVTFDTHLHVWEDPVAKTIHFRTAREGFMKVFDGQWTVQPFTQETLDNVFGENHPTHHQLLSKMGSLWHGLFQHPPNTSLVTLEQAIEPKSRPPAAISSLVCKLCAKQMQNLMEDLRKEVRTQAKAEEKASTRYKAGTAQHLASMTMAKPTVEEFLSPINITIHL